MQKKISIVTPTFNQGQFIEETILSVINQQYDNWEYIIIDGGSTDNTIDIIKKYEKHLKFWISEKDSGQADAISKGLKYCEGEIFNWLNSDDYLELNALQLINKNFTNDIDAIAAGVNVFNEKSSIISYNRNLSAQNLLIWKEGTNFVQPGVWLRTEKIKKVGGIDTNFHFSFDWDLYIRYLYHFPIVFEMQKVIVNFRLHECSKTESSQSRFEQERLAITKKLSCFKGVEKIHGLCRLSIKNHDYLEKHNAILKDIKKRHLQILMILKLMLTTSNFKLLRISIGGILKIMKK